MSEQYLAITVNGIGNSFEHEFRVLDASYDARVAGMTKDLVEGVQNMGQVMLTHMWEAEAVAHDHDIQVTDVDRACTILLNRTMKEKYGK